MPGCHVSFGFGGILGIYGIGATIRIGREMFCLPYAGFLKQVKIISAGYIPMTLLTNT